VLHSDQPDLHSFPTRRSSDLRNHSDAVIDRADMDAQRTSVAVLRVHDGDSALRPIEGLIGRVFARYYATTALDAGILVDLHHQRSEEHTSELQSRENLVCRLL